MVIQGRTNPLLDLKRYFKRSGHLKINDLLSPKSVVYLNSKTRDEALNFMVEQLSSLRLLKDKEAFSEALLSRENIVSTGIGMGVAIPHAKLAGYDDFFILIGVYQGEEGIEWNSIDGEGVRLIFMIGGPDNKQSEYLKVLSKVTDAIKSPELRAQLLSAKSPKALLKSLRDI